MRKLFLLSLATLFITSAPAWCEPIGGYPITGNPTVSKNTDLSVKFIEQARKYRDEGRLELARQSYALAISTCHNNANLEIIRRELAGVELMIRTMR